MGSTSKTNFGLDTIQDRSQSFSAGVVTRCSVQMSPSSRTTPLCKNNLSTFSDTVGPPPGSHAASSRSNSKTLPLDRGTESILVFHTRTTYLLKQTHALFSASQLAPQIQSCFFRVRSRLTKRIHWIRVRCKPSLPLCLHLLPSVRRATCSLPCFLFSFFPPSPVAL